MQIDRISGILMLLHFLTTLASAQGAPSEAVLFADLDDNHEAVGSGSTGWAKAGDAIYFMRYQDGETSLWRTDGSASGTSRLRDFGAASVSTQLIGGELADGRLVFVAEDPGLGQELWISDGTSDGTRLLADLCPGICDSDPGGSGAFGPGGEGGFVAFGDELLFSARRVDGGPVHLFAVDSSGVVRQVSDLPLGRWVVVGERIFLLEDEGGWALWVSDGTLGSEQRVQTLAVSFVWSLLPVGDAVLVVADGGGGLELYFGGDQGLIPVANAGGASEFRAAIAADDLAYVVLEDRLIRTDGTPAGTFEVVALAEGRLKRFVGVVGDRLFFVAETPAAGAELWTSDGTVEGTLMVRDIVPGPDGSGPSRLTEAGSQLYFFIESEGGAGLWRSDGTSAGTVEVHAFDAVDGDQFISTALGVLDERLYFAAETLGTGLELWSSNGTSGGTDLVANLWPDVASSSPHSFLAREDDLVFRVNPGEEAVEYYRAEADGTIELSTTRVEGGAMLGLAGHKVILENREEFRFGPTRLTAWDPRTGSTQEVLEVPRVFLTAGLGDRLLLVTGSQISGNIRFFEELWVTAGTPETTQNLLQVGDGTFLADTRLVEWRGAIYLTTNTEAGSALWRTDGTPQGTEKVFDLESGPPTANPTPLASTPERLFLRASVDDELVLMVLEAGGGMTVLPFVGELEDVGPAGDVALGDHLLWTTRNSRLWTSDGTSAGTLVLGEFERLGPLTVSGSRAYFAAATVEHGLELWTTDGTPAGTRLVLDAEPGPVSSDPSELTDIGGTLLFSARTGAAGHELWSSYGLAESTRQLADIAEGIGGSAPREITLFDDQIIFSARRDDIGRELFSLPRTATTTNCTAAAGTMCLGDGRFSLEIWWRNFEDETGLGRVVPGQSGDSGLFYFFDPGNWEVLVKVLDGCDFNGRFWVFSAATTNVEYVLRVTDTATGIHRDYANPLGRAAPAITDTDAFATCP